MDYVLYNGFDEHLVLGDSLYLTLTRGYEKPFLLVTLPEGQAYRFRADQYDLAFWSGATNHCQTPACTAVTITALGFGYTATDQTIAYTYDPLNRLTSAEYDTGLYYQYTYDEVGNRMLQETAFVTDPLNPPAPTVSTYTYDDANRLTAVDGQAYTFDANGNLLSDGAYTYSYDGANRLTGVAKADQTLSYSYGYNGNGDRLQQTINGASANFTLDLNTGYSQVLADGTSTYLYGLERLGYSTTDASSAYLYDALGSVRQVFSVAGANEGLSLAKSYDPYGNLIYSNGSDSMYGFTGESQDTSTGLVYLRARTYNPYTGTFTSRDTWEGDANLPMSYNRWLYTNGNPVNYTDPSGKITVDDDEMATNIVEQLLTIYGVEVVKDWGSINYFDPMENESRCSWQLGNWNNPHELELVKSAVMKISNKMGNSRFRRTILRHWYRKVERHRK